MQRLVFGQRGVVAGVNHQGERGGGVGAAPEIGLVVGDGRARGEVLRQDDLVAAGGAACPVHL